LTAVASAARKKPVAKDGPVSGAASYAAASQYPALKGLLIRSARGEMSTNRSVGIFSPLSVAGAAGSAASVP
jgi:hypothetical protein